MVHMSYDVESPRINYGENSQPTNWFLNSGVTCHMTLEILYFIPGSWVKTDKYVEVADGHLVRAKKNRTVSNKNA